MSTGVLGHGKATVVKYYQGNEVETKVMQEPEVNGCWGKTEVTKSDEESGTVGIKTSGVIKAMSECQPIVGDLRHAIVVNERGSNNAHVEYLMTLTLHQQQ